MLNDYEKGECINQALTLHYSRQWYKSHCDTSILQVTSEEFCANMPIISSGMISHIITGDFLQYLYYQFDTKRGTGGWNTAWKTAITCVDFCYNLSPSFCPSTTTINHWEQSNTPNDLLPMWWWFQCNSVNDHNTIVVNLCQFKPQINCNLSNKYSEVLPVRPREIDTHHLF